MRRDLIGLGIGLIILGIFLYLIGSYLSSASYFMSHSIYDLGGAYDAYYLGNTLESIGLIIVVVGIVFIPLGYVLKPQSLLQSQSPPHGFQQPIQSIKSGEVKYCPNCRTQLSIHDRFCSECGHKF
jgi:uncharacterized membrane protein